MFLPNGSRLFGFSIIFNNDSKLLSDERSGKHTEKSAVFRNVSAESTAAQ